ILYWVRSLIFFTHSSFTIKNEISGNENKETFVLFSIYQQRDSSFRIRPVCFPLIEFAIIYFTDGAGMNNYIGLMFFKYIMNTKRIGKIHFSINKIFTVIKRKTGFSFASCYNSIFLLQ